MKKRGGGGLYMLTRNPAKDFCPEPPSTARDLSVVRLRRGLCVPSGTRRPHCRERLSQATNATRFLSCTSHKSRVTSHVTSHLSRTYRPVWQSLVPRLTLEVWATP